MDAETSKQIVLDYLAAQGRGDGEKMAALLADDVQWRPPLGVPIGQPTGRETVMRTMAEAGAKFFDLSTMQVEIKWIVAEGDKVVIRQSATAKATNGRDYANEYVWVYIVRDGRIAEIEEHVDSKRFADIVLD
ncbi:MAG: nuclear transport factor 2 family protein [Myxococcota bacterium]